MPMPQNISYKITPSGVRQLEARLENLKKKLQELNDYADDAFKGLSTYSDMEFTQVLRERLNLQTEVLQIKHILNHIEVLKNETHAQIEPGCRVKMQNHVVCYMFQLVDPVEANIHVGKVSTDSPLGRSVLGKKVGDEIAIRAPSGEIRFFIKSIK